MLQTSSSHPCINHQILCPETYTLFLQVQWIRHSHTGLLIKWGTKGSILTQNSLHGPAWGLDSWPEPGPNALQRALESWEVRVSVARGEGRMFLGPGFSLDWIQPTRAARGPSCLSKHWFLDGFPKPGTEQLFGLNGLCSVNYRLHITRARVNILATDWKNTAFFWNPITSLLRL